MAEPSAEETVARLVSFRPAEGRDVDRLVELLKAEHLPSGRLEEHIEGFVVAERGGDLVGGGGIEVYDSAALVRSVVVAPSDRGRGLGRAIALELERLATSKGVTTLYLFTVGAWSFWERMGYSEIALEDWSEPARRSWQHVYVSEHMETFRQMGLRSMWKPVRA